MLALKTLIISKLNGVQKSDQPSSLEQTSSCVTRASDDKIVVKIRFNGPENSLSVEYLIEKIQQTNLQSV